MSEERIQREPCGCVYNAATDIYEHSCNAHASPAELRERLARAEADNAALAIACRWALNDLDAIWHLSIHTKDKLRAALAPAPGQPLLDRLEKLESQKADLVERISQLVEGRYDSEECPYLLPDNDQDLHDDDGRCTYAGGRCDPDNCPLEEDEADG